MDRRDDETSHSEKLFMMERIYRNSNCVLLVFEALAIL